MVYTIIHHYNIYSSAIFHTSFVNILKYSSIIPIDKPIEPSVFIKQSLIEILDKRNFGGQYIQASRMFYYKYHEETNDDPLVYDYVLISNFNSEFVSNSLEEIDDLAT